MKYLLLAFFFLQISYSQNVSIQLKFQNVSDSIPIVVSKSINDNAAYFLYHSDTIFTKNNKAELKFDASNPGYVYFSFSKANPGINVLYEPNETIVLNISKNPDNKYHIHYEGRNSSISLAINVDTIYKYQKFSQKLRPIIFNASKGSEILNIIKREYKLESERLKTFYENGEISKDIYEISKLYLESTLVNNSKSIIEDVFRIEEEYTKTKLPKSEFLDLLNNLMSEFNPFDDKFKNFTTYAFIDNIQSSSRFIAESGLDEKQYNKGLFVNKKLKYNYNYIPIQYQEHLFAFFFINDVLNEGDLNQFKKVFPKSPYTQYLEKFLGNKKAPEFKAYAYGYFINGKFEYNKQVNSVDITSIIKDNFSGKAVFVDLWASYCAPCFQEFSHSQKLFTFLKTNNIEMLYLAIDKDKEITKWLPNIKNNYLEGNHIFTSDKIQESLQKLLNEPDGVYIPRYLLFNSKGELVLPSTKKPSEGQALYDEILNALK